MPDKDISSVKVGYVFSLIAYLYTVAMDRWNRKQSLLKYFKYIFSNEHYWQVGRTKFDNRLITQICVLLLYFSSKL